MLKLRPAQPYDEDCLLKWRNDPVAREAAFDQGVIAAETHKAWFAHKLADPGCRILIAEDGGRRTAQVRLERISPDVAEVHIVVAPEARGRGMGRQALLLALPEAPRALGVGSVEALVKRDNEPSLRAFRAAGFVEVEELGDVLTLRRSAED